MKNLYRHWNRTHLFSVGFILLFATLGVALLLLSHAATPYASIEPETGSTSLTPVNDSTASGGRYVQFGTASSGGSGTYSHVVLVIDENYSPTSILTGSSSSPYFISLKSQGELLSGYHGVSHPSEPNYLALFTGSTQSQDGSDNCVSLSVKSLIGEMTSANISAKGFMEGLTSGSGYACRHDPFSQLADAKSADTDFSNFPTSASGYAALPKFSFVAPNLTDDMHDTNPVTGGNWAQSHLDGYTQWAKANNSIVIYITDENDSDPNYNANQPGENGNNALGIVVGSGISAGKTNSSNYDHYSLLRTIEDWYGLGHLGSSASASDITL